MQLNGVPNDIINNLDPLALIIFIPIMDRFFYPAIRRLGFNLTPLKKIFVGYMLAAASMIAAAVLQYYIYKKGPCGEYASECKEPAPINVWVQAVPYVLIAFSEIFTSITGYEYAYTKAPTNMKSLGSFLCRPSLHGSQLTDHSSIHLPLHERYLSRHLAGPRLPVCRSTPDLELRVRGCALLCRWYPLLHYTLQP